MWIDERSPMQMNLSIDGRSRLKMEVSVLKVCSLSDCARAVGGACDASKRIQRTLDDRAVRDAARDRK